MTTTTSHVAILADTHVPTRAPAIPDWVADEVRGADRTIHAGDFDSPSAYETVADLAGGEERLVAVGGNVDPPPSALDLPTVATVSVGGVTFAVTHGTGGSAGYGERVLETIRDEVDMNLNLNLGPAEPDRPVVAVAGHIHEVRDETVDGVRLCNPGSATGAWPADRETMMRATVADGDVRVELLEADPA